MKAFVEVIKLANDVITTSLGGGNITPPDCGCDETRD